MKFKNQLRLLAFLSLLLTFSAVPNVAQSPNTASLIVVVNDQNGAVVPDAKISVTNNATGDVRDVVTGGEGSITVPALSLTGTYTVSVSKTGFGSEEQTAITLRSGETATLKVTLVPGTEKAEVTVFGTTEGVRADPQIGRRLDSPTIDETPILGRKVTTLPLLNSAFRQAKGTGDLFVNATYFVTGVGGRRSTTVLLDGGNNDDGWGRQTAIATVPLGAIQEVNILSNAFSAEYGWTSGPALNIVTKGGTNDFRGEALGLFRPGGWQARRFSTKNFCPPSVPTCITPSTLQAINPVDIPDALQQYSGALGGPIIEDKTFFFAAADYTRQNRTTFLSPILPSFVLSPDGRLDYTGHYRQFLFDGRIDHKIASNQNLTFRANVDRFDDDNPQDAVSGTNAPTVARRYTRRSVTAQVNYTWVINANLLNEARLSFLNGDPVTLWEAQNPSTTYTRAGNSPFTIGESRASDIYSRQMQLSDTLSWTHGKNNFRFGGSIIFHTSGGTGSEPGTATLGTFTFLSTGPRAGLPFSQLTLNDVQSYTQPVNYGISSYKLNQWLLTGFVQDSIRLRSDLTLDVGLRYDRQTLTDANKNFAPRIGFGWNPGGDSRLAIRGGYGMYYTQIRSNAVASYLVGGLNGLTTYTATPGQTGFPTCLTGACLPVPINPRTLPLPQQPPRNITLKAGLRSFYQEQFAAYGLNFNLLPNYPDELRNPRSQVFTIGAEREFFKGFFVGADYVRQHLSGIDRTLDLNAPASFNRTAAGQVRTVAAANLTRPIVPVNGSVRTVNVLTNLGVADYNGLQTQATFRGNSPLFVSVSYTLSKTTNTSEPDGNGIGPNQANLARLGEEERGPSLLDQRHRAVINVSYRFPFRFTAGTLMQFASARPFNSTTGVDNDGDGATNDRPFVNGSVLRKSAFRGTGTQDVSIFVENRIRLSERMNLLLRLEGFNLFNHGNFLGRGVTVYGNAETPSASFGRFIGVGTEPNAIPVFANIDPPRMFQLQARFSF